MQVNNLVLITLALLLAVGTGCSLPEQAGVGSTAPAYAGRTLAGEPVVLEAEPSWQRIHSCMCKQVLAF